MWLFYHFLTCTIPIMTWFDGEAGVGDVSIDFHHIYGKSKIEMEIYGS
jgi:hypothetical protein